MGRRQKGKGGKRKKSWHRGRVESRRAAKALKRLPTSDVEPTGEPQPVKKSSGGKRLHGDAV